MSPDPTDQPEPGRPPDPRDLELAREAAAMPAVFLILNGLLGLVLVGLLSVPFVFNPDLPFNWVRNLIANNPQDARRQEAEQKLDDAERQMNADRAGYARDNAVRLGVLGVLNLVAVIGGFYMRSLAGYRMAVAGAVVSIIPVATGCCFTGIPFGIWALVVLARPDVRAAFAARRNAPPTDPDAQYMR